MVWNWELPEWPKFTYDLQSIAQTGFRGGLRAENYISITKTSKATATRDLSDLVQKGALVKTGELRHTRYRLNLGTIDEK